MNRNWQMERDSSPDSMGLYHAAMISPRRNNDRCRIGGRWYMATDFGDRLNAGVIVEAVIHFERHIARVGDVALIDHLPGETPREAVVSEIVLTQPALLDDEDLLALRIETIEELFAEWPEIRADRPLWLTRFSPAEGA